MRKSFNLAVVMFFVLGLAGAARGAVLSRASISLSLNWVRVGTRFALPPITGTGVGTSVGAGGTATFASNVLTGTAALTGITAAPPITQVVMSLTGHAAGNFTAAGGPSGGLGGPMAVAGSAIRLLAYSGSVTGLAIPLSPMGRPGGFASVTGGGGTILQVYGTGWTTGVQTLMAPATEVGGGTTTPWTGTATGADLRTASGAGTLVLISPLFIRTNIAGDLPTFATMTLNYVPEPSTLLLVGLGIAGLALRGRRKA
jgi:hypothetical protein